jgi:adenosylcobinamide-GDP ribazoletransferase
MQALRHYLLAVQFFTRIPVTGRLADWVGYSPAMLRASAAHFPGIGWLAAGLSCAVTALLHWGLGAQPMAPLVAAVLSTVATVVMTGGFHEDGLADVADGLGGSYDRERALDIMKDSRIGAFGAMALVLALLAKVSLLALLGAHSLGAVLAALAGGHVLSRLWPLFIVRWLPHVGDTARSKSKPLADQISRSALVAAALWCFMPLALVYQAQTATFLIASVTVSLAAAAWMGRWFARRLQGFTGDCLGATQQVGEIGFYLGAALALGAAR